MKHFKIATLTLAAIVGLGARAKRFPNAYDFCAVQVFVTESLDGEPLVKGVAELLDPSGKVVQTNKVVNGQVEFCDFGFGDYSILIHQKDSLCAATEIRNVHVIYGFTQKFRAVLNFCGDQGDGGPGTECPTYVRVSSPHGEPIKAAEIQDGRMKESEFTDSFGRVEVAVAEGRSSDFAFSKPGYKTQHLRLTCPPNSGGFGVKRASVVLDPEE